MKLWQPQRNFVVYFDILVCKIDSYSLQFMKFKV